MNNGLPQGWAEAPLRQIADARMGETILAKQLTPTGVPVYSAGQVNEPWGFLDQPKKPLGKGTVVVSARGSIGFPKIPTAERFASTQTTIALRFPDEQLSEFVCQWLKTVDWTALTKGGAIPMLTVGEINELIVPLAPFGEQRRIVAKLEKLLDKVDTCQQRLAKIPALLKRFRQSVLAAACSGRLTADWREETPDGSDEASFQGPFEIPIGWKWVKWGNLAAKEKHAFKRGPFGSALKKEIFVPVGYKVYEQCNPINDNCSLGRYYITAEKFNELEAFKVNAGDLLISCSGVTLGRITQVPESFKEGVINQALLKVTLNGKIIRNDYFIKYFRSTACQAFVFEGSQGSAQPNIKGVKELKELPVPVPPLPEQQEIVRRVEGLFVLADQIEARYAKAKAHVEKLTQSILAKAFRGELVPQDPNDEPASVLLERVKREKAARTDGQSKIMGSPRRSRLAKASR